MDVLVAMHRQVSLKAWSMKLTCRLSPKFSSSKPQILLDPIQRRMKDKDKFMIDGEEMMSCCLTKETHQTAPRLALDEERNCRVGGRRIESSENCNVHSLRNGHVEALAKSSDDQMDRVDESSFGGIRWTTRRQSQLEPGPCETG